MEGNELDDVRKLIELFEEERLLELEVEEEGLRVLLRSDEAVAGEARTQAAAPLAPPAPHAEAPAPRRAEPLPENWVPILSPMVGIFYRSPSPESPPYVEEGSIVEEGEVVGIIEAMKVFNEIVAEVAGKIVRVVAQNEQEVKVDDVLFLVEPLAEPGE
ncbi:MAG: acetyl-CoA carboxylase biotin carboxyl carrier protein [Armatimonadota bacterium]